MLQVVVQRQTIEGQSEEVTLRHRASGVHAFQAFQYANPRMCMDGPQMRHSAESLIPAFRPSGKAVGKLLSKAFGVQQSSDKADGASSPMVGYANLAVGLLNLGMSGYNTYQLHSIKKLQKATNGKVDQIAGKMSHLQTAFQATAGSLEELHGKVGVLGSVLEDGMSKLQLALQDHQLLLHGMLAQCSALQQGQAALATGQQLIMDEVLSLHADVQQGNAAILSELMSRSQDTITAKLWRLSEGFKRFLSRSRTEVMQEGLVQYALDLQADAIIWMGRFTNDTPDGIAQRQPFVMAYAIAALAWDAADGTGDAECRDRSRAALQMVDADIMALMTKCTLYTFGAMSGEVPMHATKP